jgi:hypothetical protein
MTWRLRETSPTREKVTTTLLLILTIFDGHPQPSLQPHLAFSSKQNQKLVSSLAASRPRLLSLVSTQFIFPKV